MSWNEFKEPLGCLDAGMLSMSSVKSCFQEACRKVGFQGRVAHIAHAAESRLKVAGRGLGGQKLPGNMGGAWRALDHDLSGLRGLGHRAKPLLQVWQRGTAKEVSIVQAP